MTHITIHFLHGHCTLPHLHMDSISILVDRELWHVNGLRVPPSLSHTLWQIYRRLPSLAITPWKKYNTLVMCLRTTLDAGAFWLWYWEQKHWCGLGDAIDKNVFAYGLHLAPAQPSKRYPSTCAFTVSGSSALSSNSVRYTLGLQCITACLVPILLVTYFPVNAWTFSRTRPLCSPTRPRCSPTRDVGEGALSLFSLVPNLT